MFKIVFAIPSHITFSHCYIVRIAMLHILPSKTTFFCHINPDFYVTKLLIFLFFHFIHTYLNPSLFFFINLHTDPSLFPNKSSHAVSFLSKVDLTSLFHNSLFMIFSLQPYITTHFSCTINQHQTLYNY